MGKKTRILMAKMGLDCHDTGIVTVSHLLRESGYDVIYLGLHNSAEKIVRVALDEDVDVIGISFLSGQHMVQTGKLINLLRKEAKDIMLMVGGVIPPQDIPKLMEMGVSKIFTPGTLTGEIVGFLEEKVG